MGRGRAMLSYPQSGFQEADLKMRGESGMGMASNFDLFLFRRVPKVRLFRDDCRTGRKNQAMYFQEKR